MTKYVEEHHFAFDGTYDEASTNEQVCLLIILDLPRIR
jgi:hypothetical protein